MVQLNPFLTGGFGTLSLVKLPGILLAAGLLASSALAEKPKLVLVISIDQFRADYLRRFQPYYLPANSQGAVGGFSYLMARGADYADAHHAHVPTATGPGHAAILTGSAPTLNGIIGNEWFDPKAGRYVYCVDDADAKTIGGPSKPMSPKNLWTTTVGDELKLATGGRSKVVGISFKDRAAILLAGHAADTVIWLDTKAPGWVTSSWYAPSGNLPAWVSALNAQDGVRKGLGGVWKPLLDSKSYDSAIVPPFEKRGVETVFSHPIKSVGDFTTSAFGQEFLFQTVETAIDAERLGQGESTDLLAVNLATNDYVGHAFGPDSPEVEDISIRTDRLLSHLFNKLDHKIPGGLKNVLIAITADHGVVPIPEEAEAFRLPAKRYSDNSLTDSLNAGLTKLHGEGKWVLASTEPNLYLNDALIAEKNLNLAEVRREAAEIVGRVPGIAQAFTAEEVMGGHLPAWPWVSSVSLGFNLKIGGDLMVFSAPGAYFGGGVGTGHGTPWAYDSHVPLLIAGPGIHAGKFYRHVTLMDLAPTICQLLGIEYTTGNMGTPLREALEGR